MTSLALSSLAATVAMVSACGSTAAQFTGKEHPVVVTADEVVDFGIDQPAGHEIIGVASVRCKTTNGASGLFEVPCTEESMVGLLRERAAQAGGTGLVELRCDQADLQRTIDNVDGGTVQQTTRGGLTCHATVVRRGTGVQVGAEPATRAPSRAGHRVTISGVELEVGADGERQATAQDAIGELERFPEGYADLGRAWARCLSGCARSVARRALRAEAARHGAAAIAELGCELIGEAWRCQARQVGAALVEIADAGGPEPDGDAGAEPDARSFPDGDLPDGDAGTGPDGIADPDAASER